MQMKQRNFPLVFISLGLLFWILGFNFMAQKMLSISSFAVVKNCGKPMESNDDTNLGLRSTSRAITNGADSSNTLGELNAGQQNIPTVIGTVAARLTGLPARISTARGQRQFAGLNCSYYVAPPACLDWVSETNIEPEDIKPEEMHFFHRTCQLPELPEYDKDSVININLRRVFAKYDANPCNPMNVPVYGLGCVTYDCQFVEEHLRAFDVGIGHVVIVLNRKGQEKYYGFFQHLEELHPGRLTFVYRPYGSCAETFNTIMKLGFAINPLPSFVWIANADLFPLPGTMELVLNRIIEHQSSEKYQHQLIISLKEFSSIIVLRECWELFGRFDEAIFPAYSEDDEYIYRMRSIGYDFHSMNLESGLHLIHAHGGSTSGRDDEGSLTVRHRMDRQEYLWRKWGIDRLSGQTMCNRGKFRFPWNITGLSHRTVVVDPVHRECLRNGNGPFYTGMTDNCWLVSCKTACFYNTSVLLENKLIRDPPPSFTISINRSIPSFYDGKKWNSPKLPGC